MALSADEQRALAEIERRLATDDPGLATCLSAFRRPGPGSVLRSPRARIVGSLFTVLVVAMVSLMVYAMIPFRTHTARPPVAPSAGAPTGVAISASGGTRHTPTAPATLHASAGRSAGAGSTGAGSTATGSTATAAAPPAGRNAAAGQAQPSASQATGHAASSASP